MFGYKWNSQTLYAQIEPYCKKSVVVVQDKIVKKKKKNNFNNKIFFHMKVWDKII